MLRYGHYDARVAYEGYKSVIAYIDAEIQKRVEDTVERCADIAQDTIVSEYGGDFQYGYRAAKNIRSILTESKEK